MRINLSMIIYYYVPMVNEPIVVSDNFVLEIAVPSTIKLQYLYYIYIYLHFDFSTTRDAIMLILNCSIERIFNFNTQI